uniref:TMF_TATA_bd domain-containing protein n=1 Tax=Heterorhabditis bacteriophora TaxID=37862 RepID=A0A1I7XU64_HETBA
MDIITSSVLQPSLEPQIDACREELRLATDDSNICGIPSLNVPTPISSSHDFLPQLNDELKGLRQLLNKMNDHVEKLEIRVETEVAFLNKTLDEERGKTLKLEMTLNETIELHQAEFQALKQEQQSIANRLDYQYNDRFKRVEESVESVQNHMYRMENSIKDTLDLRLGRSAWGNAALLSGVNILV